MFTIDEDRAASVNYGIEFERAVPTGVCPILDADTDTESETLPGTELCWQDDCE